MQSVLRAFSSQGLPWILRGLFLLPVVKLGLPRTGFDPSPTPQLGAIRQFVIGPWKPETFRGCHALGTMHGTRHVSLGNAEQAINTNVEPP